MFGPSYLEEYEGQLTTKCTQGEVDFIEQHLCTPGTKILDLACGHGRHTIALARRGYHMTGIDLNAFFLGKAQCDAEVAGVKVCWVLSDMRKIPFADEFDLVVNLFTAFGYLENDDEDTKALRQTNKALKLGGFFLIDTLNREYLMCKFTECSGNVFPDDSAMVMLRRFDFTTSRLHERRVRQWKDGRRRETFSTLRLYSLHELIRMCATVGFEYHASFGNFDSSPYGFASERCIAIFRKIH